MSEVMTNSFPPLPQPSAKGLAIRALRRALGKTQTEFAVMLGLRSAASVSEIENSGACSLTVALRIEQLSDARIDAADLSADVAAARKVAGTGDSSDHAAADSPSIVPDTTGQAEAMSRNNQQSGESL